MAEPQNRRGSQDGCQRIAQLVGQHCEEFVLPTIDVENFLVSSAILHRGGGNSRELQRDRFVFSGEVASELVGSMQRTEVPAIPADKRDTQPTAERGMPVRRATEASKQGMRDQFSVREA